MREESIELSFELRKAYHAKQAAYEEMATAREKMQELNQVQTDKWNEAEKLQAKYDEAKAKQDEAWTEYNAKQNEYKAQIGAEIEAINECKALEANFLQRATDETHSAIRDIYQEAAKFFSKLEKQKVVERDGTISLKRSAIRPDNSTSAQILERLKQVRNEHKEILESYHFAKNDFNLKNQEFNRLNQKYQMLSEGKEDEENTYTSIPKVLELTESLLLKAGVPEKFWEDSSAEQRADGTIDIYYGRSLGDGHGHVVLGPDYQVQYHRQPIA
ncbi:hypothetical protein IJ098_03035 [Candidatus Saccharibacteria bacterium]|nr:hypothetical protein [Candidatus Saccharibacteria bacterium]